VPSTHLTLDVLTAAGLRHATTTRYCLRTPAGSAPFSVEARTAISGVEGDAGRVAFAGQVHGAGVVHAAGGGRLGEADVIVTTTAGQPLAVVTADCLPIVLYDPARPALALAHVGWRGTVKGATRAAVEALIALGADPSRILAAIGPSIGPCCYEVDRVVIDPLVAAFGPVDRWAVPHSDGKWMLDLWAANEAQLAASGVARANVHNARLCTSCRTHLFHSYRRGSRGRLVTLAQMPASSAY